MNFIKNESKIYICDIGASPCDPTEHLEDLLKNTDSFLYGFEPSEKEFNCDTFVINFFFLPSSISHFRLPLS